MMGCLLRYVDSMCEYREQQFAVKTPSPTRRSTNSTWTRYSGNAFHNRGPTPLNDRLPKLTSFVRGTSNMCCCEERVRPVEDCLFSMSARYRGAVPSMHRHTCRSILG